jgi:hypothetical protein
MAGSRQLLEQRIWAVFRMGELVMERSQAILSAINSFGAKSSIARKVKTLIHSFRRCHPKC